MKTLELLMCEALATFVGEQYALAAETDVALGAVLVNSEWPEGDQSLPAKGVTILMAGEPEDIMVDEEVVRMEATLPGQDDIVTYRVACRKVPLQLDIWAQTSPMRERLLRYLDDFLRTGTAVTLGDPLGSVVRDGPLLMLPTDDNYRGFVDYTFEAARRINDGEGVREFEQRAMRRGSAIAELTVRARSPKLARVRLEMLLSGQPASYEYTPGENGFAINTSVI